MGFEKMNYIDCYVTKVLSEPHRIQYSRWWSLKVEYNSMGIISETELFFRTKEEALYVQEGYHFFN